MLSNGHSSEDEDSEVVSSPCGEQPPLDAAHVPKKLWRHSSIEVCTKTESKNEAKVLVLYTGGTIGMIRNDKGGNTRKPDDFLICKGEKYFFGIVVFFCILSVLVNVWVLLALNFCRARFL